MSKFFRNFILFLAITILVYPLMVIVWGVIAPSRLKKNLNYKVNSVGFMHTRLSEIKSAKYPDILFIGSSTAYRGYDPRIFREKGITILNFGSSAQTPIQTRYLLERYLHTIKPELLVLDVTPLMFTIDGVESSLDLITNDDFNDELIRMAIRVNHLKVYNTLIYTGFINLIGRNSEQNEPRLRKYDKYISGGFVERELSFNKKANFENEIWEFQSEQFKEFEKVVSFLKSNNVGFLIAQAPIAPRFYHAHQNNCYFDSVISQHGNYLNFNKLLLLDDSLHFYDNNHLNQNGVEIFNRKMIDILLSDSLSKLVN